MKYMRIDIPVGDYYIPVFFWKKRKHFRKAIGCKSDAGFSYLPANKHYPLLGEMHFVRNLIDVGIVAHEITHASLCLAERIKKQKNEEFICETSQVLTNNFWHTIMNNDKLKHWIYRKGRE